MASLLERVGRRAGDSMAMVMIIEGSGVRLKCLEGCIGEERGAGGIGEDILEDLSGFIGTMKIRTNY